MKPGAGKQKGGAYEREICKLLSHWVSDGRREDLFWRSAMSGGRATVQRKKGQANRTQVGDISAVDPLGAPFLDRFIVECKAYRDLQFEAGFLVNKGKLRQFWMQLMTISVMTGRHPMLIARQNRMPSMVIVDPGGAQMLCWHGAVGQRHLLVQLPQWNALIYNADILRHTKCPL